MTRDDLVERLYRQFPNYDIDVALSAAAQEVCHLLDPRWIEASIAPQVLTNPTASIYLRVMLADSEQLDEHNVMDDIRPKPRPLPASQGYIVLKPKDKALRCRDVSRHLILPAESVLSGTAPFLFRGKLRPIDRALGTIYDRVYNKAPLALDTYRQWRNTKYQQQWNKRTPAIHEMVSSAPRASDAQPWMWVAMHWLEPGGAEAWAFEQMRIARRAGYRIVLTADRIAPQRLLSKAYECADDIYLCAQTFGRRERETFVAHLLQRYRPRALHIHHGALAYEHLPLIRTLLPTIRVEDSTHIIEHRGGGFVASSIYYSNLIDMHHVISPELREVYETDAGIDPAKVLYRPLTRMDQHELTQRQLHEREARPLRVGFLGRMSPQKRPYLFVEVARRLHKRAPNSCAFVMQGSGHLEGRTKRHIERAKLKGVIESRPWGPVSEFFDEIDVLLITSDNEGLALTSLEASSAGVLVVSADVGSQATVVAPGALLPRHPREFIRGAVALLSDLATNEQHRLGLLARQNELGNDLINLESASEFFIKHYSDPTHQLLLGAFDKEQS